MHGIDPDEPTPRFGEHDAERLCAAWPQYRCGFDVRRDGATRPPSARLSLQGLRQTEQGDWIPVRDVRLRGPGGSVEIKAGAAMLDELQEHLELRCH